MEEKIIKITVLHNSRNFDNGSKIWNYNEMHEKKNPHSWIS